MCLSNSRRVWTTSSAAAEGVDGADNFFFVEGPEIFERAAAARDDQHVYDFAAIEELNGANDLRGGAVALDAHGIKGQVHIAEASAQDAHHVSDGRAAWRGDEADAAGEKRQRLLAVGIEEAFGFEAAFELLEGELESAEADRLDVLDVNLVFASGFVDADGAAHGDVQAVFGTKLHGAKLIFETDALYLRAFIFQGAIDVAGLGFMAVGDFAGDPDVGKVASEKVADFGGQLGDREGATLGHEIELKLAHDPPPPGIFVNADSKGVTGAFGVKADSKELSGIMCLGGGARWAKTGRRDRANMTNK